MSDASRGLPPTVQLAAMPKAELHLHLDGCLRLSTVADLAEQADVALPVSPGRLSELCVAPDDCRDLMQVLSYFALPVAVLQTGQALERVTYELCEDLRAENVRYAEIRFAPSLHQSSGLSLDEVIAAVVRGWGAGREATGLAGGIILCGIRQFSPEDTMDVARAGLRFLGRGVVGFDLAGDEAGYPVLLHREPLLWARAAGYGMTIHAGEAAGAESVRDAVEVIGASRIGHGVRSEEDAALMTTLRERRIMLEMCPRSNLQTRAVSRQARHPLARYYRADIPVSVNTDNRTVSDTTLTRELSLSHDRLGLAVEDLAAMTLMALDAGFGDPAERQMLRSELLAEMEGLGIVPASLTLPQTAPNPW